MTGKKKYLDAVARFRARFVKTPLSFRRRLVAGIIFVVMVVMLSLEISPLGVLAEAGKPSKRTITAPRTVQFVDKAETKEQQDAAAAAVQDVNILDSSITGSAEKNLGNFFQVVNQVDAQQIDPAGKAGQIGSSITQKVSPEVISGILALTPGERQVLLESAARSLSRFMEEGVTETNLEEVRERIKTGAGDVTSDPKVQRLLGEVVAPFLLANSYIDRKETDRRRKAARDAVRPVITTKLQGEVIINKGEVVTAERVEMLKSLGFRSPTFTPINLLYMGIFSIALLAMFSMFLALKRPNIFNSPGLLSLLGALVIAYTVIAKLLTVASSSWSPFWNYLMPSAAVALITAVLLDSFTAIMMVTACGVITGVVSGGDFSILAFAVVGGIFPSLMVSRLSSRHGLRRAGLYTSFWLAFVALGASVVTQVRQDILLHTGIGFLNGVICTIVAIGTLPFLETTFRVTTNTWLLDLASPEQELLKELSVKAPGTYSHSVMVANLAEAAAREVGSDPMLARVAAYYHDVGKVKRPQFFVENQLEESDPHKNIGPNLSSMIITSHVKDGVEMLEKNHLPPDIVDIVKQHHGTGVVRYFYERALENEKKGSVDETRFRYHYDRPRRRTAGILMLADSVEATARTLHHPSAASIEQMVDRIVNEKLEDGQLDECGLTFNDVRKIKNVFTKILISAYHPRLDYPAVTVGGKRKNAGKNNNKPPTTRQNGAAAEEAAEEGSQSAGT